MNTKTKNILLIVLGVAVVGMTVAFAALSSQLKIQGTASVPNVNWNIHFQNWDDNTEDTVTYGGNTHQNTAVFPAASTLTKTLSPNITKVDGLNVTLYQPGDYASYTFEIINEGTIDASLDNFTHNLTCASGNDCSHLSYTVECVDSQNNNVLTGNPTLAKNGGLAYCTLTVTYTDQTNQNSGTAGSNQVYTQSAASATLDATWVYVQKVDSQANSGSGSGLSANLGSCTPIEDGTGGYYYNYSGLVGYDGLNAQTCGNGGDTLFVAEPNPEWVGYYYNTGTRIQACGVFNDGAVCLDGNPNGYADNFVLNGPTALSRTKTQEEQNYGFCFEDDYDENGPDSNLCYYCPDGYEIDSESGKCYEHDNEYVVTGYVAQKKVEMEEKGATCTVSGSPSYHDATVECSDSNTGAYCTLNYWGSVFCHDGENGGYEVCGGGHYPCGDLTND